jgi:hypothetical protein
MSVAVINRSEERALSEVEAISRCTGLAHKRDCSKLSSL